MPRAVDFFHVISTTEPSCRNMPRHGLQMLVVNPLDSKGNYSATWLIYEVGILAVDGWAVTFGTARRGLNGLRPYRM